MRVIVARSNSFSVYTQSVKATLVPKGKESFKRCSNSILRNDLAGCFTGWTNSGGLVVGTTFAEPPHSGSFQAEFLLIGSLSQSVATTAGASYTIDFFLAAAGAPPNSFSVGEAHPFSA